MHIRQLLQQYRWQTAVLGTAVLLVLLGAVWAVGPANTKQAAFRSFTVESGWGGGRIASELHEAGLIRSPFAFTAYTKLTGSGDQLKAGTYELSPAMGLSEIVQKIATGAALSTDISLTIPEGMNVWEIDELLTAKKLIVRGSFARTYINEEGRFFPDTYRFDKSVADHAKDYGNAKAFGKVFKDAFAQKAQSYTSEQVIIASMLEKEAKTAEDMAIVSGIIAKRRQQGMLLQLDATVAYGWCLARWIPMSSDRNCDVTQSPIALEIKKDGPYNTYMRAGLPVGPISNPGVKALSAAARPKDSPYLYYLSTRDGSQIIYAKTLDEHLKNRLKYLGF